VSGGAGEDTFTGTASPTGTSGSGTYTTTHNSSIIDIGTWTAAFSGPNTPSIACAVSQTWDFPLPGMSTLGVVTLSKYSYVTMSGLSLSGCVGAPGGETGSSSSTSQRMKNSKCECSTMHGYYEDRANPFLSLESYFLRKAYKKLSANVAGSAIAGHVRVVDAAGVGEGCGATEGGYLMTGKSQHSAYKSFMMLLCFGADTGSNLASGGTNGWTDLNDAVFGGPDVVASAQIDPATSFLFLY
jgi:hypothetical protein